jgi:hypothetical protein
LKTTTKAGVHPKWHSKPTVTAKRRAELVATITAAVRELFPGARFAHVSALDADPRFKPMDSVELDTGYHPTVPRPGTVGHVARLAGRSLMAKPKKDERPRDGLDEKALTGWLRRKKAKLMDRFRAAQFADILEYHAAEIPVAEFTPADWQRFLTLIGYPPDPKRWADGRPAWARHLRLLHGELGRRGLDVGGKVVPE